MIPTITDQGDGIMVQFDMENGMAIVIKQSDEAAQQLVNIIQNKLNARIKEPGATRSKSFALNEGQAYDGDEAFLHFIEQEILDNYGHIKKNATITVVIEDV